jgi:hypothetical protein
MKRHNRASVLWRRQRGVGLRLLVAAGFGLFLGVMLPAATVANAEEPVPDSVAARDADVLFQQLLKDPKNVDLTFRYAQAAIKAGNIEGGISSLERLLLLDRNFPGVKIQLAELYGRIHSYDMAKTYLAEARSEPGVTQEVLDRIQAVQTAIDHSASPSNLTSTLLVGVRHQSDASAQPAGSDIIAGGVPQTLSTIYIFKQAWDIFATGNVQYITKLGDVPLETNALAYYSKSLGHSTLDLGAVELNSGPRFEADVGDMHLFSARPYAVTNEVSLGESQFLHTAGGGIDIDRALFGGLTGAAFYEYRRDWFNNVAVLPGADMLNADVHSFGAALSYRLIENGDLHLQGSYARTDDIAAGSNRGLVIHLSYTQLVTLPPDFGVGPLNVSPFVYRIYSRDDDPDPALGPTVFDATNEWRYGLTAKLGLSDNIATNFNFTREVTTSNVAANRTNDTQVMVGLIFSY